MAEIRKYAMSNQPPDIAQILLEAQNRWLRPTEICQILSNYKKFSIAPEPPNRPPSGSLFLFDRKILRYFRKDGHNWRKKKDGKTVKEAHEKLKVGSVDVLHCYYAHGQDSENFQRRTYWLLEEGFMNIVLVHYLEVKGGKQSFSRAKEGEEIAGLSNADSPACSNSFASQSQVASQSMDAESPISGQISEYEDAETDNSRASSRYHPFTEMQQPVDGIMMDNLLGASLPSASVNNLVAGYLGEMQPAAASLNNHFLAHNDIDSAFNGTGAGLRDGPKTPPDSVRFGEPFPEYPGGFMEPTLYSSVATMESNNLDDSSHLQTFMSEALYTNNLTQKEADALSAAGLTSSQAENESCTDRTMRYPLLKQSSLDPFKIEPDGLKKFDSFSRWMSNELAEVVDLDIKSSSDAFWSSTETVNVADGSSIPINEQLDAYVVSPSLSQDQLFSIIDVSPSWAYNGTKTKVLIAGTFLANKEDVENYRWSCMFGDVEVPAEVLVDGSLRCYTPEHHSGRVPFYVTCSNRLACSEVREFEFRDSEAQYMETPDLHTAGINEMHLHIRLEKLLSLGPDDYEKYVLSSGNKSELIDTINSLMLDDKLSNLALLSDEKEFSTVRDQNLEKLVKEKLYYWLIHKIHDDGKGPNVLGKEGQGVIHLVAALGYDWAIRPIVAAGVNVNFRDIRGWTALHWAASCGRELAVGALIANGAASGALTVPTPQFSSGRTPADLASENGHKGIAGFLAESALTSHLLALTLKESHGGSAEELCGLAAAEDLAESSSAQLACVDSQAESLKDSLSAVCKSTQAAARIKKNRPVGDRPPHGFALRRISSWPGREKAPKAGCPDTPQGAQDTWATCISLKATAVVTRITRNSRRGTFFFFNPAPFNSLPRGVKPGPVGCYSGALTTRLETLPHVARMFQAFRGKFFHRKTVSEYGDDDCGLSDERTFKLVSLKNEKPGQSDMPLHSAAVRIQNKFRGWKGRKEFMIIRQKIVKIQAHVRGHQVRKSYRKIVWSVGIVEKIILRWRRKRRGLCGFQPEKQLEGPSQIQPAKVEDEYDFLKDGRKQAEGRLQRALARVHSMTQYPEARDQYCRLQNCVTELQESKVEEPHSTFYKDVMAWFFIGKQRQKGALNHTCMQQAGCELLGRDDIRQKITEKILLDGNGPSNCTVICINGGSGLGKTSLLRVLYNDQQLMDAFDKRIWIQMSEKLDIVMLFRKIIEFALNDHCNIMSISFLQEMIMEEIADKKLLLFLDDADIEDQQFWNSILEVLNASAKGSAIVMATRSVTVAGLRGVAAHSYFLNPLSEENNLMLLQQYAIVGTDIQSNPDSVVVAKRFISRFGDNPLNLKAFGGLLCHTDTISLERDKFDGSVMPLQLCHDVLPIHL